MAHGDSSITPRDRVARLASTLSLVSAGTERMLVGFGKSNLLDKAAFAANKPVEAPPDTLWHYSSGTSVILAGILDAIEEPT